MKNITIKDLDGQIAHQKEGKARKTDGESYLKRDGAYRLGSTEFPEEEMDITEDQALDIYRASENNPHPIKW